MASVSSSTSSADALAASSLSAASESAKKPKHNQHNPGTAALASSKISPKGAQILASQTSPFWTRIHTNNSGMTELELNTKVRIDPTQAKAPKSRSIVVIETQGNLAYRRFVPDAQSAQFVADDPSLTPIPLLKGSAVKIIGVVTDLQKQL